MNSTKLLKELMMKNGRNVKLNKQYFLVLTTAFLIQIVSGISFALAVPCEDVMEREFKYNGTYDDIGKVYEFLWWGGDGALSPRFTSVEDAKSKLYSTAIEYVDIFKGDKAQCLEATTENRNENKVAICMSKTLANNNCDPSVFKKSGLTSRSIDKSNQSSSGSTSQSNNRANQQSANQSSSSNSTDLGKMSRDQLFTTINAAIYSKDWVKAYAGLQQLSKDPDPEISRQAIRKMGEYLYLGQGVKQNLGEADRLFEKASSMGDLDAYAHLCGTYKDREGAVNHKIALDNCLYAAERGHPFAQAVLGWLYHQGDGITQNIQLSNNWTCKAAAQGEATAVGNVKKQNISCN